VAEDGLDDVGGVEGPEDDLGQPHVEERERAHEPGAVHQLLSGEEALVVAEPSSVGP
jgi:hypothetical protein